MANQIDTGGIVLAAERARTIADLLASTEDPESLIDGTLVSAALMIVEETTKIKALPLGKEEETTNE